MPTASAWSLRCLSGTRPQVTIDTTRRVSVRPDTPAYVRWLAAASAVLYSGLLANWFFELGRQASLPPPPVDTRADEAIERLESELYKVSGQLAGTETKLSIEQASRYELARLNAALVQQNAKLAEEQSAFLRLLREQPRNRSGPADQLAMLNAPTSVRTASVADMPIEKVSIADLTIRPSDGRREYRYRFRLALEGAHRGTPHRFTLQMALRPRPDRGQAQAIAQVLDETIELKNYRTINGRFIAPYDFTSGEVEIRLLEAGRLMLRQSSSV